MIKLRNKCGCTITDYSCDNLENISGNAKHLLESEDWEVVED